MRRSFSGPCTSEDVPPLGENTRPPGARPTAWWTPGSYSRSVFPSTSASALVCPGCKFMLQNLSAEVWKPEPRGHWEEAEGEA